MTHKQSAARWHRRFATLGLVVSLVAGCGSSGLDRESSCDEYLSRAGQVRDTAAQTVGREVAWADADSPQRVLILDDLCNGYADPASVSLEEAMTAAS